MTADVRVIRDRRAPGSRFHLPERRSGFDRRVPARNRLDRWVLRMRDNQQLVLTVALAIAGLNALDLVLTLAALDQGVSEANPIMARLFDADIGLAATLKLATGVGAAAIVWWGRRFKLVLQAAVVLLMVFVGVTIYHIFGAVLLAT